MLVATNKSKRELLETGHDMVEMRGRKWSDVIKRLQELDDSPNAYAVYLKRVPVEFNLVTLGVWYLASVALD